jgi:type IV pilus assembly protein PilQ
VHRGAPARTGSAGRRSAAEGRRVELIDLDVKDADIHDVMRLLADVGRVNLVVADTVHGKVTMRLRRVAWDQVACTIAALHDLRVTVKDNIILVVPRT